MVRRQAGLRGTAPRSVVVAVVRDHPHADTDTVLRAAREQLPAASVARCEARVDDRQHLVCRGCGAIADVDSALGTAACLAVSAGAGFVIDQAEVFHRGRCPACTAA